MAAKAHLKKKGEKHFGTHSNGKINFKKTESKRLKRKRGRGRGVKGLCKKFIGLQKGHKDPNKQNNDTLI